jgi:CRISPR/Cas system-associated endoribonuclease Cas2
MARKMQRHKSSLPALSPEAQARLRKNLDKIFSMDGVSITIFPGTEEESTMTSEEWKRKRGLKK